MWCGCSCWACCCAWLASFGAWSTCACLPDELVLRTARCIHSGRPWDYIVQRGGARDAPRVPTTLQWACVHNWSLGNARGCGLLIWNLKRASAKLRRYLVQQRYTHAPLDVLMSLPIPSLLRDQLGMVVYPGQAGATVTQGCTGLNWLGGERHRARVVSPRRARSRASWGLARGP